LVKDIALGLAGSLPQYFVGARSGHVLFGASDGVSGMELWQSDGTAAGTYLEQDIAPGPAHSNPTELTTISQGFSVGGSGTTIYFAADNGVNGRELWKTRASDVGVFRVYLPLVMR
jgi:ELWxxDGT repeat protein